MIFRAKSFNIKPSRRSCEGPHKFRLDKFSRFDVYWTQADRQTDKQAKLDVEDKDGSLY